MPTSFTAFAKQVWSPATRVYEAALPTGITGASIVVDRTSLTGTQAGTVSTIGIELSQDGGATWADLGGIGFPDGTIPGRTTSGASWGFASPANANRRLRLTWVGGVSLNTAITGTLTP